MQITLSSEENFWFISEVKLYLSYENPGPIDVNWEGLAEEHRMQIRRGLAQGRISSDVKLEALVATPVAAPAPQKKAVKTKLPKRDTKLHAECTTTLQGPLASVKKVAGKTSDVRKLRLMLELEQAKKARKGVVLLLETRIKHINKSVVKAIDNTKPDPSAPKSEEQTLADLMAITDSEQKEVTIKIK